MREEGRPRWYLGVAVGGAHPSGHVLIRLQWSHTVAVELKRALAALHNVRPGHGFVNMGGVRVSTPCELMAMKAKQDRRDPTEPMLLLFIPDRIRKGPRRGGTLAGAALTAWKSECVPIFAAALPALVARERSPSLLLVCSCLVCTHSGANLA